MTDKETEEAIKSIFRHLHVDLTVRSSGSLSFWMLSPSYEISRLFLSRTVLKFQLERNGRTRLFTQSEYTGEEAVEFALAASEVQWEVQRLEDRTIGAVLVKNPFYGCGSLDEALLKADLLFGRSEDGQKGNFGGTCGFTFIHYEHDSLETSK